MDKLFLKFNRKILIKITLIFIAIIFALFLILLLFANYLINSSIIENKFNKLTGLKIEFIDANFNLDAKLNLNTTAKEINIYDKEKNIKFITLNEANLSIKPLSIIFKKIYIKKADAKQIQIDIKRDENGNIDLINSINKQQKFFDKKIKLTRINSNINNINIIFNDNYQTKNLIKLKFNNSNIFISQKRKFLSIKQEGIIETNSNNQKQISNLFLDINSKYNQNQINTESINFDINFKNIDLYIFKDLAKKYISNDIISLNGKSDLILKTQNQTHKLNFKISKPTLILKNNKKITPYKNSINLSSNLLFSNNKIKIEKATIQSDNLLIASNGLITNAFSKKPIVDINTEIKETEINNLIPFIPDNAMFHRPKGIPTLKKSNFHGIANAKLNIKTFPLNINGNLKIENVHIPNYPKPYKQNDVNVMFMGDKARIYTRVYTPDNEYVLVDGISNLDNSLYGKYNIKSTPKIDLAFTQLYLIPIQQIIGFNIGPVSIMDTTGYGNINITTQGTLFDAQVYGNFSAYNATTKMEGINAKLTEGKCKLTFNDKKVIFEEIKGKIDNADVSLTGNGDIKGNIKLLVKINNANTEKLLNIFNNSIISKPYISLSNQIKNIKGAASAEINLSGKIEDYENASFLETLQPSGKFTLNNNEIELNNNFKAKDLSGILKFGQEQKGIFSLKLRDTKFNIEFFSKDNLQKITSNNPFEINLEIFSNKIGFKDIIETLNNSDILNEKIRNITKKLCNNNFYSKLLFKSKGFITINNPNLENLKINGYLIGLNSKDIKDIKFNSGMIKFENNKAIFDNLDINIENGNIKTKGHIKNILSKKPSSDLFVFINNINLNKLNPIIPNIKSLDAKINNGQIIFKNDDIKLNSISINWSDAPIFLNANIKDLYGSKAFNMDFSSIINEHTSDNIINPYLISPLKITGEIPINGSFKGNMNNYNIDFNAIIPRKSDISYSGANIGDINHRREINGQIEIVNSLVKIHNLKLIKYISNQNNKINPLTALKINGQIKQKEDSIQYDNLKISTGTPMNVRILNLIFKKSILKRGNFDCNITLNDNIKLPKLNGKINLYDLDIPLYDTKIDNIKFNISNKLINGEALAKNNQSDIKINIQALNKLSSPYIIKNVDISSNKLNINNILSSINPANTKTDIELKTELKINPQDIEIENGSFNFKEIQYDKISAQNLKGQFGYKTGNIDLKNIFFDIAQGYIEANGIYNLYSTKLNMIASLKDCDSNILTKDFLNLTNQIYGKINGTINLSGKNLHTTQGINSINSDINFSINNGKMPKLGSLEYLLRASNLIKNGLLTLSLNNIIEILTPYKTGEFETIFGNLSIDNGEIKKLNILSQGKNLSLYLEGNYSILENFADIQIYGKLSQNISNALGAIGNASLNQFVEAITQAKRNKNQKDMELQEKLNKIPPVESENSQVKFFKAKVLGDINKDNYIKNFNWI